MADSAATIIGGDVVQVSPLAFPDVVEAAWRRAAEARAALGPDLGSVIPKPLETWRDGPVSCARYARFDNFASGRIFGRVTRSKLKVPIFDWLAEVAKLAKVGYDSMAGNLASLSDLPQSGRAVTHAAEEAVKHQVPPLAVPMHGDLWLGNLLKAPAGSRWPFMIIDWRGSLVAGHPIYDLIRVADSLHVDGGRLRVELRRHARLLDCSDGDTRVYLLSALGHIWRNLDQFPRERFVAMALQCCSVYDTAMTG